MVYDAAVNKAVDTLAGLVVGFVLLGAITGAAVGTFFVLYSAVVWLDLPDIPHGVLGVGCVIAAVLAGAVVGKVGDRLMNGPRRRR